MKAFLRPHHGKISAPIALIGEWKSCLGYRVSFPSPLFHFMRQLRMDFETLDVTAKPCCILSFTTHSNIRHPAKPNNCSSC